MYTSNPLDESNTLNEQSSEHDISFEQSRLKLILFTLSECPVK